MLALSQPADSSIDSERPALHWVNVNARHYKLDYATSVGLVEVERGKIKLEKKF